MSGTWDPGGGESPPPTPPPGSPPPTTPPPGSPYPPGAPPPGSPPPPVGSPPPGSGGFPPPPQGFGGPPGYTPGYPPPGAGQSTDGFAIAALVTGLIPCTFFLGPIFGFISLRRIKQSLAKGRGMAIAGIIAGFAWLAIIILVAVFVDPDEKAATDLEVGDCFDNPKAGEDVRSVKTSPCDESHDAEVYATFDLSGDDFPGDTKVIADAEAGCTSRFEDFVGTSPAETELRVFYLYPTEDVWDSEKTVSCSVIDPAGKTTGSLEGSNR